MASFFTYSCVCDTDRTIRLTMSATGLTMSATGLTMSGWLVDSKQEQPVTVVLDLNPQVKLTLSVPFWPSWHRQSSVRLWPSHVLQTTRFTHVHAPCGAESTGYLPRGTDGHCCTVVNRARCDVLFRAEADILYTSTVQPCFFWV